VILQEGAVVVAVKLQEAVAVAVAVAEEEVAPGVRPLGQ
jgi:hypothetical protein